MAKPNLITGKITIPAFQQYTNSNPTADLNSGSPNISNITDVTLLYPGLEITNSNLPSGTTVVSVNYGAQTAVLSNNATATSTGENLVIQFPDGLYYCPDSTFTDINGVFFNYDITVGFQIVNQATDANSFVPLSGVFNLWEISYISNVDGDGTTMDFYVVFDEEAPYSDFQRIPTDAVANAITQQTSLRSYGWNVSSQVYGDLAAGSEVAQSNLDAQNISDYTPIIVDPNDVEYSGSWYVKYTGSAVTEITQSIGDNSYRTVTITLETGSSGLAEIPVSASDAGVGLATAFNFSGSGVDSVTIGTSGIATVYITGGGTGTSGTSGTSGNGTSGTSGTSGNGTSGTSGTSGNGTSGTSGTSGLGTSGTSGTSGKNGTAGTSGTSGSNGTAGWSPASGPSGTSGSTGTAGTSGESATSGASINGSKGTSGTSGKNGAVGTSGTSGSGGGVPHTFQGTGSVSGKTGIFLGQVPDDSGLNPQGWVIVTISSTEYWLPAWTQG